MTAGHLHLTRMSSTCSCITFRLPIEAQNGLDEQQRRLQVSILWLANLVLPRQNDETSDVLHNSREDWTAALDGSPKRVRIIRNFELTEFALKSFDCT